MKCVVFALTLMASAAYGAHEICFFPNGACEESAQLCTPLSTNICSQFPQDIAGVPGFYVATPIEEDKTAATIFLNAEGCKQASSLPPMQFTVGQCLSPNILGFQSPYGLLIRRSADNDKVVSPGTSKTGAGSLMAPSIVASVMTVFFGMLL